MALAQMRTPHTAELISEIADPPLTIKECFRTRLKMDDENYRNVLNWYKSCIKLGETKSGRQKDAFTMRLIQNLLRSSSEFFGMTKLSQETVAKIESECASMVDRILYPSDILPLNDFGTRNFGDTLGKPVANCSKTSGPNMMARLLKHIQWTAIIASVLILLILLILLYFCIALRSCPNRRNCDCPCDKCDEKEQRNCTKEEKIGRNKKRFSCRPKRKKFNKQICDDEDEDDVNLIARRTETTHSSTNVISINTAQLPEEICSCESIVVDQTTSTNFKRNRASGGETELDLK